jgi:AhpD family alkylhydroperoxidase
MTVKTDVSRFHIHDELTAPDGSVKILNGVQSAGGEVSKFIGVLAGSPAALRAYARMRHELRGGVLPRATRERIGLAVAERRGDPYSLAQHAKTARAAGLGLDEISLVRSWRSSDEKEAALLVFLEALSRGDGRPSQHLAEEAREHGWSDEQILEAIAYVALERFTAMVNVAGDVPVDGSAEDTRTLRAA